MVMVVAVGKGRAEIGQQRAKVSPKMSQEWADIAPR